MTPRRFSYGKKNRPLVDLTKAPSYEVKWKKLPKKLEDVEGLGDVMRALENK